MAVKMVIFAPDVMESLLTYSKMAYPNEGILILRGKSKKGVVRVTSLMVPPAAIHAHSYSSFNWSMLPLDLSYIGVAHSHPSGNANPSDQDRLHATGRIMVIMGYPFASTSHVGVFDHNGNRVPFEVGDVSK